MEKIKALAQEKSGYIVAVLLVLIVLVKVVLGIDVPGVEINDQNWLNYVMAALGLGGGQASVNSLRS